jgi:hypothetical protein
MAPFCFWFCWVVVVENPGIPSSFGALRMVSAIVFFSFASLFLSPVGTIPCRTSPLHGNQWAPPHTTHLLSSSCFDLSRPGALALFYPPMAGRLHS